MGDQQYGIGIHIPDRSSIFTAQTRALLLILENIEKGQDCLIASDSMSCLQALESIKTDHFEIEI